MSDYDEGDDNYFDEEYGDDDEDYEIEEELKMDDETKNVFLACENNLYSKHQSEDIVNSFKEIIKQIANENGISLGRAFLILQANNYDSTKCDNIPSKLIDIIFYKESKESISSKNTKNCLLCFDDLTEATSYSLDCNHNFCKESCFREYMRACLKEGSSILTKSCPMDGCKERLGIKEATEFFRSTKEMNLYNKFLLNDILQHSNLIIQCPHSDCNQVLDFGKNKHIEGKQLNLRCSCQKGYFCSLCKEDAHLPCSCDMLKKWMELIQGKNTEDMNTIWLKLNTKPCPKCKVLIEKNQGCMHMNCKNCNFHFCWLCLGEYVNHNDFYSCNKYKKEDENPLSNEQEKLKKYEFYTDRFKDYVGAPILSQKEANGHLKKLSEQLKNSDIKAEDREKEMEFYIHAYDILIEAKKCIAYTYPIGYFIENHKRTYFEFLQGELEKNLNPFEDLLNQANFSEKFNKETQYQGFYEYKQKVVEYTSKIKKYLCNMMKDLGEELPELDIKKLKSISKKISKLERAQSRKQQKIVDKGQSSFEQIDPDVLMCDDCKINPVENDYGLCNNCLNTRYQN